MRLKSEMQWRSDPDVEAARKLPGWGAFHRVCAQHGFYFDHCERTGGRRGEFEVQCYTLVGRRPQGLSVGRGKQVLDAYKDAHDRCGRATPETEAALWLLIDGPAPVEDEFASLLGDDFEDLLG